MQETSFIQESWNIKRIGLAIIILALLFGIIYGGKVFVLDKNENLSKSISKSGQVAGLSTKEEKKATKEKNEIDLKSLFSTSTTDLQANMNQKLDEIKKEANSLDIQEIASSSPQIQKIINDLKSIEDYPKNQAREACQRICESIK